MRRMGGAAPGFTLIEIAIAFVIIGLLITLGAALIGPLTKRAKYTETKEIIEAAAESIAGFAAPSNRIPTVLEFPGAVRNSRDAWSKDLYYIPDADLDDLNAGGVCGRKSTNLIICRDAACAAATNITNVAFLVVSGSLNFNIQTEAAPGGTCPAGRTCAKVYDVDTPGVDDYVTDMNRPEPYDDLVKWATLDELRTKAGCVGAQIRIVNNELPYGFEGSVYSATVFGDGGVPFAAGGNYRWCREESMATGLIFAPATLDADCSTLAEALWGQADDLIISGSPTTQGSYSFTFFVRDDNDPAGTNDNIAQKTFALTVNPTGAPPGGCTEYRVWNDTGSRRDFMIDASCERTNNNGEITNQGGGLLLGTGEVIDRYNTNNGTCGGAIQETFTYAQAQTADTDADCRVNFSGSDR